MKILVMVLIFLLGYMLGRDYWIHQSADIIGDMIEESKTIEELKEKIRKGARKNDK